MATLIEHRADDLLRERGEDIDARVLLLRALGFGRADLVVAAPGIGEPCATELSALADWTDGIAGLILSPAHGTEAGDIRPLVESGLPVLLVVRNVPPARVWVYRKL